MVFPNWSRDVFVNNLSENNRQFGNTIRVRFHIGFHIGIHTGITLVSNWHSADMCAVRLSLARARTPAMISHMAMPSRRRPRGRPRCSHTRPAMILRVSRPASRQASMPPHKPCYGFAHTEAESRPASRQASTLPYSSCQCLGRTEAAADPKPYIIIKGVGLGLGLRPRGHKQHRILIRHRSQLGCLLPSSYALL